MNHNVITNWIIAIATVVGVFAAAVLYIGNINGKLTTLENDLLSMRNRIDGLYIYISEQGGDVKKAVLSSDINDSSKKQIINSFLPMDVKLKSNIEKGHIKD